jgi:hypothetical protein
MQVSATRNVGFGLGQTGPLEAQQVSGRMVGDPEVIPSGHRANQYREVGISSENQQ